MAVALFNVAVVGIYIYYFAAFDLCDFLCEMTYFSLDIAESCIIECLEIEIVNSCGVACESFLIALSAEHGTENERTVIIGIIYKNSSILIHLTLVAFSCVLKQIGVILQVVDKCTCMLNAAKLNGNSYRIVFLYSKRVIIVILFCESV